MLEAKTYAARYGAGVGLGVFGTELTNLSPVPDSKRDRGAWLGDVRKFPLSFDAIKKRWVLTPDVYGNPWLVVMADSDGTPLYDFGALNAPYSGDPGAWNVNAIAAFNQAQAVNSANQGLIVPSSSDVIFQQGAPNSVDQHDGWKATSSYDPLDNWGFDAFQQNPVLSQGVYNAPVYVSTDWAGNKVLAEENIPAARAWWAHHVFRNDAHPGAGDLRDVYKIEDNPDPMGDAAAVGLVWFCIELPSPDGRRIRFKACGNRWLRIAYLIDVDRHLNVSGAVRLAVAIWDTLIAVANIIVGAILIAFGGWAQIAAGVAAIITTWISYAATQDAATANWQSTGALLERNTGAGRPVVQTGAIPSGGGGLTTMAQYNNRNPQGITDPPPPSAVNPYTGQPLPTSLSPRDPANPVSRAHLSAPVQLPASSNNSLSELAILAVILFKGGLL